MAANIKEKGESPVVEALQRLEVLGTISDDSRKLVRTFLSKANRVAAAHIVEWMKQLGMTTQHAADGTVRGILPGKNPSARPLLLGSHLDTVIDAGKFDGPLGIVSALAALETLREKGVELPYPVHILAFSDEEGVRFQTTYLGSRSILGPIDDLTLAQTDGEGSSLGYVLATEGWHTNSSPIYYEPSSTLGYLELHIEQGRVLEEAGEAAAVVSGIAGQTRLRARVTGHADHAGTTPMEIRRDALTGAAEAVLLIEEAAKKKEGLMATVGQLVVEPGASNSIPQSVVFTIDLRHPEDSARRQAAEELEAGLQAICERRKLSGSWEVVQENDATPCDEGLTKALLSSLQASGGAGLLVPSGAGHDGVVIAEAMPIGMVFVRCRDGLSHHPDEYVSPSDVEAGIGVLSHFLTTFDPA